MGPLNYAGLVFLIGCGNVPQAAIEDLREPSKQTDHRVSLTGSRDGDLLPARVIFESSSSQLLMDLRFRIGVPTRLESGQYHWQQADGTLEGQVRARSVTFLGGQSDNPNLGGVFELLSSTGRPLYKVTLPTSEVKPLGAIPWAAPSH